MVQALFAPAGRTGVVMTSNGNNYVIGADGSVNAQDTDVPALIDAGFNRGEALRQSLSSPILGLGSLPSVSGLTATVNRSGDYFTILFTLAAVRLTVTDAAGSGSSASLKIFDFDPGSVRILGSRMDFTAFAEGAALTGGAGDAAFVMALGSVAADAGDGALTGTEVDIGAATSTITLSGGTGTGTKHSAISAVFDGTATALDVYLNWSGTAATIDANSTIDVTGTITITGVMQGDD